MNIKCFGVISGIWISQLKQMLNKKSILTLIFYNITRFSDGRVWRLCRFRLTLQKTFWDFFKVIEVYNNWSFRIWSAKKSWKCSPISLAIRVIYCFLQLQQESAISHIEHEAISLLGRIFVNRIIYYWRDNGDYAWKIGHLKALHKTHLRRPWPRFWSITKCHELCELGKRNYLSM